MAAAAQPLMTLPQLAQFAGGDLMVRDMPSGPIEREAFLRSGFDGVTLDTRTIRGGELFVPLAGSQADGHAFLEDAFRRGAAAALCARARYAEWQGREPGPLVVVDDVTEALQRLAHRHRESWSGLLLGVTGSAGKTTTKDLVALALSAAAPTLKTEGNLNNHWGVPLTLLRLRPEHRAAVVEMGTSGPGEIAFLAALAAPGAAVLTNAGHAHLEGLGSLEAIAEEKASLAHALQKEGVAFAGADSPRLIAALAGVRCKLVRYGLTRDADVRPKSLAARADGGTSLDVEGFPRVELKLVGRHQVANALAALAVAREWRIDPGAVAAALSSYRGSKGRMEVRHAQGATLLVDTYNANPDSTRAALETLAAWPGATRRIAVLGDMLELGEGAAALHRDAGAAARDAELWAIGAHAADYAKGAKASRVASRTFEDFPALRAALGEALAPGVTVLLKASRGAALERALEGLEMED
ncbi:MAG TPA: UDP-N-acetylmuramoyl-tripeptide--D-alanyl-D-alanine ligase [Candidatus Saccharimonadaceae bacterium]|jgi:UDP-N-acetylmuramoyl-tripeptide--D-alanyl-D-alanine ligase|nr:UDP-N-acetylmuramoyl-tripeptide--D-alanyl-D-alanine ligase [Candidatus Saccharimonadaceae bacterium]